MLDQPESPDLRNSFFANLLQSGPKISTWSVSVDLVVGRVVFESHSEESASEPLLRCVEIRNHAQSDLCVEVLNQVEMQAVNM